ncbi:MAG: hypothetical protein MUF84_08905 [Anaerolineae bacterium]|jgi:hypothetical protein|nr:hypothetical protein [Anaerolineae bacterium]
MNWYEGYLIGKIIAEERIAPKRRKDYYRPPRRSVAAALRPLVRALASWLF